MILASVKSLLDFGLVVLIWMTQLIVYPSFSYYSENQLINWHNRYTMAISVIVMPLMLGQVLFHGLDLINEFSVLKLIAAFLVGLVWLNTFFFAVPLHNQISAGKSVLEASGQLVSVNWYRAVLWTAVFLIGLLTR